MCQVEYTYLQLLYLLAYTSYIPTTSVKTIPVLKATYTPIGIWYAILLLYRLGFYIVYIGSPIKTITLRKALYAPTGN